MPHQEERLTKKEPIRTYEKLVLPSIQNSMVNNKFFEENIESKHIWLYMGIKIADTISNI